MYSNSYHLQDVNKKEFQLGVCTREVREGKLCTVKWTKGFPLYILCLEFEWKFNTCRGGTRLSTISEEWRFVLKNAQKQWFCLFSSLVSGTFWSFLQDRAGIIQLKFFKITRGYPFCILLLFSISTNLDMRSESPYRLPWNRIQEFMADRPGPWAIFIIFSFCLYIIFINNAYIQFIGVWTF